MNVSSPNRNTLPITLVLCLILSGCAAQASSRMSMPPSVVTTVVAARGNIATFLTLDGQIAPLLNATLSSSQSGNVVAVYVNEGDRVRQGTLLAKIDDAQLRAQLAQAQGEIASALGQLGSSELTRPIQSTEYASTFEQARASLSADEEALQNAKLVYESDARLYPQGYVAQTALEQARAAYVAAQQQVTRDRFALRTARVNLGRTLADAQSVAAYRGSLEQARAAAQQLSVEIAQTEVRAPFDGIVTARLLDPGAFASPNQPILTVSHLSTVYVNINVPDNALAYVRPGVRVAFTSTSFPGKVFSGAIFDVNAVPTQGTLSYRARIRYVNPDETLRGGMLISAVLTKERREKVVVVPRAAIFQADGGDDIFTVRDGKAIRVPVRVGLRNDEAAEVSGLQAGTSIIVSRPDSLQDGAQVAVTDARNVR